MRRAKHPEADSVAGLEPPVWIRDVLTSSLAERGNL